MTPAEGGGSEPIRAPLDAVAHFVDDVTPFWTKLYTYAWFVGFAIAAMVYGALEHGRTRASAPARP
jgi:NCS1 family nucleobase:cation symporter-1